MTVSKKQRTSVHPPSAAKCLLRSSGSLGAAQAKAHLLSIMDEVKESGTPVIITRRGVPQVQIAPLELASPAPDIFGCMKGTVTITGDIIGPEPDVWEAMQ